MSKRSRRERRRARNAARAKLEYDQELEETRTRRTRLECMVRQFEVMNARVRLANYRALTELASLVPRHLWGPDVERAVRIVQALAQDEARRARLAEGRRLGLVPPLGTQAPPPETILEKLRRWAVSVVGG